jgi:hypothetical protein
VLGRALRLTAGERSDQEHDHGDDQEHEPDPQQEFQGRDEATRDEQHNSDDGKDDDPQVHDLNLS